MIGVDEHEVEYPVRHTLCDTQTCAKIPDDATRVWIQGFTRYAIGGRAA